MEKPELIQAQSFISDGKIISERPFINREIKKQQHCLKVGLS